MKIHEKYIKRCIEIAKNGLGSTRPNPMVGCVIVHNNAIIGEGFTSPYGGAHAEVNAINAVKNQALLQEATLYVTLEPCSHYGKTPPCSDLIVEKKIPNVVIGTIDTHSKVAGKGIERLKKAGCNVTVGVLENACKTHHKRFFTFHNKKRPYIILKWAETANGFIAPKTKNEKKPVWITNSYSRQLVHRWRAEEQAILVGTNTVIEDNPSLTVRDWTGENPVRIVLDKNEILSQDLNVFNNEAKTILVKETSAKSICDLLFKADINSVIIEGGSKTLRRFINENLWDEARVFISDTTFDDGIKAPDLIGELTSKQYIKQDILKVYANNNSN
ncbi:bifunctional diaminohydroxyphosphoribosylaminopyrimidine deaminase/5-amino-6-(5-phosphoribosylamino)uracil reductase RibD [Corallibacter sp.]|uniref:bifunctional diaminohydroxyphosphoribosylaminopyrimidine deaminase/5-amino-6-(5-phosphoribosylamino)uracil reductase RibD n=1 Tax=Corallibacter sp. TaxID=2038084 RepID=UPI003A916AC2